MFEYAYSLVLHGDGDAYLLYFENNKDRLCYVIMQNDIGNTTKFDGLIEKGKFFDWETPYGYGGPLCDFELSEESQKLFKSELYDYCINHNIVSQFIRFHPLLKNDNILPCVIETRYLKDTVFIDTTNPQSILSNMDSKNRNMVRKAQKNNVEIVKADISEYLEFLAIYNETMKKHNADEYYFFDRNYFNSIAKMNNNAFVLYALLESVPICSSIILYNDNFMHYHLSGSKTDFRKYSPNNLLLYESAVLANKMGIAKFHLGGGIHAGDSLFEFKKQFNKNGMIPFFVGRTIFISETYDFLIKVRKDSDSNFDINNSFMIQYRR